MRRKAEGFNEGPGSFQRVSCRKEISTEAESEEIVRGEPGDGEKRGVTRMKSWARKAGVISVVMGLTLFGYSEVWGKDWKLFKKTVDAKFYYDAKDIIRSSEKMARVWIKQVYTKKGKMDMINLVGPRYEHLSYSINSLEFDCGARIVRVLSMTHYSKAGDILGLEDSPDKREAITPNSMFDALYNKVCK